MRRPAPILEDDAPIQNYALRLTEAVEDEVPNKNFALRLNAALEAIQSHEVATEAPLAKGRATKSDTSAARKPAVRMCPA